jgi:Glycerophosphoryl diester phosphodiesterase family
MLAIMRTIRTCCFYSLAIAIHLLNSSDSFGQLAVSPLPTAHAHNDYAHKQPLADALAAGFCSVEVDVFLVDGELLVGHTVQELQPDRTLSKLYLEPLKAIVEKNQGSVFPTEPRHVLWLHIDIKSDAKTTFAALNEKLRAISHFLTRIENGEMHEGPIRVVISGNRDYDQIAKTEPLLAAIDGRMKDLESDLSADVLPLLSDSWRNHFKWDGIGEMPTAERRKLIDLVDLAHRKGRKIRFWATPETPELWRELRSATVDFINTDRLDELREFLTAAK